MKTKDIDDAREKFRSKLKKMNVAKVLKENKDYIVKGVITNYSEKGVAGLDDNFDIHDERGWEIIMSTDPVADDRIFSPDNSKDESLRAKPLTKTTKDGFNMVFMRIPKEKFEANLKEAEAKRKAKYLNSVNNRRVKKASKSEIVISEDEVNMNNIGEQEND